MNEEYHVGDFGHAIFIVTKRDYSAPTDCYGIIQMMDKKWVLFSDNDGMPYLIEKSKFKFTKEERKVKK